MELVACVLTSHRCLFPYTRCTHDTSNPLAALRARPTFFKGVATVVAKLFNVVQPTTAYFGQKDVMQCVVIRSMVQDLNFPVRVVICPTEREHDGLAMSSRNAYLDEEQRAAAPALYKALCAGKDLCSTVADKGGIISRGELVDAIEAVVRVSHICAS